jgi:hypothetical protein
MRYAEKKKKKGTTYIMRPNDETIKMVLKIYFNIKKASGD